MLPSGQGLVCLCLEAAWQVCPVAAGRAEPTWLMASNRHAPPPAEDHTLPQPAGWRPLTRAAVSASRTRSPYMMRSSRPSVSRSLRRPDRSTSPKMMFTMTTLLMLSICTGLRAQQWGCWAVTRAHREWQGTAGGSAGRKQSRVHCRAPLAGCLARQCTGGRAAVGSQFQTCSSRKRP